METAARVEVPTLRAACIEYPGYIQNVEKALATLGGAAEISSAVIKDAAHLPLRFRPEEPLCHPVYGDRHVIRGLVLRISHRRTGGGGLTVKAVARIDRAYTFSHLADYQYLPHDARSVPRDWASLPEEHQPHAAEPFRVAAPFMLVPPIFSKVDEPIEFSFKEAAAQPPASEEPLARSRVVSFFAIALPPALDPPAGAPADLVARVREALRTRPVWSLQGLREHLAGSEGPLPTPQTLLPLLHALCYQFRTGPWKTLYISCGYDPRQNPASRLYQIVAYRMSAERAKQQADAASSTTSTMAQLNSFTAAPTARTTWLQLGDLQDEAVQRLLAETPMPERASEPYGWLNHGALQQVQAVMTQRFGRLTRERQGDDGAGATPSPEPSQPFGAEASTSGAGHAAAATTAAPPGGSSSAPTDPRARATAHRSHPQGGPSAVATSSAHHSQEAGGEASILGRWLASQAPGGGLPATGGEGGLATLEVVASEGPGEEGYEEDGVPSGEEEQTAEEEEVVVSSDSEDGDDDGDEDE